MNYLEEFEPFCRELAAASGEVINKYYRSGVDVEAKGDESPVTIADRKAEEVMRDLIMQKYPDHAILGEEHGKHNQGADLEWVLDPIDGTISFVCGAMSFGTLIALRHKGIPVLGVFHQPVLGEFLIGDGKQALLNGENTSVRDCQNLNEAVLLATDLIHLKKMGHEETFNSLMGRVKLFRMWGDCYGYYLLATGYADIMVDPVLKVWDISALVPIVRGAGGVITDIHGKAADQADSAIAAAPGVHAAVVDELKRN